MKGMEQYTSIETTPMAFHKLNKYLLLPIAVLLNLFIAIGSFLICTNYTNNHVIPFETYFSYGISSMINFVFFFIILFYLFTNNSKVAKVFFVFYALSTIILVVDLIYSIFSYPENIMSDVISICALLFWWYIYYSYYYKRIPIFNSIKEQKSKRNQKITVDEDGTIVVEDTTTTKYKTKKKLKILVLCLCIALLLSLSWNLYQMSQIKQLGSSEYQSYSRKDIKQNTDAWRERNSVFSPTAIQFGAQEEEIEPKNELAKITKAMADTLEAQKQAQGQKVIANAVKNYQSDSQKENIGIQTPVNDMKKMVYCDKKTSVYHMVNCENAPKETYELINAQKALEKGYKPCSKCNPPQ